MTSSCNCPIWGQPHLFLNQKEVSGRPGSWRHLMTLSAIAGGSSNANVDVPDVKNGNRKLIFSLFQCPDSTNSYSGSKTKAFRFVVWDKSVPSSETSNYHCYSWRPGQYRFFHETKRTTRGQTVGWTFARLHFTTEFVSKFLLLVALATNHNNYRSVIWNVYSWMLV